MVLITCPIINNIPSLNNVVSKYQLDCLFLSFTCQWVASFWKMIHCKRCWSRSSRTLSRQENSGQWWSALFKVRLCYSSYFFVVCWIFMWKKKTEHAPNNVSPTKHLTNKKLLFYPPRAGSGLDLEAMMMGDIDVEQLDGMRNVLFCSTCAVGINSVLDALENGTDYDTITNNFINVCIDLGIASPIVCENFLLDSKVTCGRRRTLQRPLMNIVEMNDVAFPCVSSNN